MYRRRRHSVRTAVAAAAVFATAVIGGTLHAAIANDPMLAASNGPVMIQDVGTARFVTTDTGLARFITTDTPSTPLMRGLMKLGLFGQTKAANAPFVLTDEAVQKAHELGVATVTTADDGSRTLTVQTPSEWVFELKNE